jgi:hypothetical protein
MSGLFAAELQAGVYRRLADDAALAALVGAAIYDAPLERGPSDPAEADYVTLGDETVRPNDTKTSRGAIHDFTVTVHSSRDGFDRVKRIATAIFDCLVDAPLAIEGGRVVGLRFLRAGAERGRAPERRRIGLRFRAVVDEA